MGVRQPNTLAIIRKGGGCPGSLSASIAKMVFGRLGNGVSAIAPISTLSIPRPSIQSAAPLAASACRS